MRKTLTVGLVGAAAATALAGGSAENILLVVNPSSAESMYLADYYKNARGIPDANVLYIDPSANHMDPTQVGDPPLRPYTGAAGVNGDLAGLDGYLANAGIGNHIDYVVVCNTGEFFCSTPGRITDGCWPVARLSQSSVWTTAFIRGSILAGNLPSTTANQYFSANPGAATAFSSGTAWLFGSPSTQASARKYYIGAQLGYTGFQGNTLAELLAMIDRDVASDGTHPAGTFYYINATLDPVRNVRACGNESAGCPGPAPVYDAAVAALTSRGASAVVYTAVLPDNQPSDLGIMTGYANPQIDTALLFIQPGAFCDHLTSWAAAFDINDQTKLSSWVRRGAAGSAGEVEEPCAYLGKFPNPNFHTIYYQGLSLGEAYLRSVAYVPFQGLLYGDPMTRPWATFPMVTGNVPGGTVSGLVSFTPSASTTLAGAAIAGLSLLVDGVQMGTRLPGQAFSVNTGTLADGWHEVRVLAWDNTGVKNTGRWVGSMTTSNFGRTATVGLNVSSGDMTTLFSATAGASGGTVQELRLIQNGRVVAAGPASPLQVYGRNLGSGAGRVQVEAQFTDGRVARSAPAAVNIAYTVGTFSGLAPVAYSYTKRVARGLPFVVELPARFDDGLGGATFTILSGPGQGTTVGGGTRGTRVMTAGANACGPDQFTFQVTTGSGVSNVGTVTLVYGAAPGCRGDANGDGALNVIDFTSFLNQFASQDLRADIDGNCSLNVNDFGAFLNAFASGCPQ